MPEIILTVVVLGLVFSQQIIAGMMAKSLGYSFWKWFCIALVLPVIAIILLANKKDKSNSKGFKLADHVEKG